MTRECDLTWFDAIGFYHSSSASSVRKVPSPHGRSLLAEASERTINKRIKKNSVSVPIERFPFLTMMKS